MSDAASTNDAIKAAASAESNALLAKAVKSAQLALVDEPAEEAPAPAQAVAKKPEAEKADAKTVVLERGPDGKFLKPGEKSPAKAKDVAAGAKVASPDPAGVRADQPGGDADKKPKEAEGDVPASLAKARRLFNEGKIEEGAKLVGLDLEKLTGKQWESFRHENKKARAELDKREQVIAGHQNEIRAVAERLRPLLGAQQALAAGDFDAFVNLASGGAIQDVSAFNKRAIAKLHQSAPLDAESQRRLSQAEQRAIAAEKAANDLAARLQKAEQDKALPEAQREYKESTLRNEIELCDDDEIAALADDESFRDEVFEVKNQHWDGQRTIGTDAAAVIAHRRWQRKQAAQAADPGVSGSTRDRGASSTRQPAGAVTPARRPARAGTTLNSQEAAEAAPAPKLEGKALMDYWVRDAISKQARESA